MNHKTSVSLPLDLIERWHASGLSLPEIVRRGLDATAPEPHPVEEPLRRVIREELAAVTVSARAGSQRDDCPHPKARIVKGLCNACGTNVSA
jgi:hypothetical protein